MPSANFTIHSAGHTSFTVASLSSALAFWHDLLGLPILYPRHIELGLEPNSIGIHHAEADIALLSLPGDHQVELLEYTSPNDRAVMKPRPCDVGNVHLALDVTSSDVLIEEVTKLGWIPAVSEPVRMKRGDGSLWSICYIRGPDGMTVELMEELES